MDKQQDVMVIINLPRSYIDYKKALTDAVRNSTTYTLLWVIVSNYEPELFQFNTNYKNEIIPTIERNYNVNMNDVFNNDIDYDFIINDITLRQIRRQAIVDILDVLSQYVKVGYLPILHSEEMETAVIYLNYNDGGGLSDGNIL